MTTSALARGGEELPDWHTLMAAFGGAFGNGGAVGEHPVTVCAGGLARVHQSARRSAVPDRRRAQLVEAIDAWAAEHVRSPERVGSLGAYVDRMAAAAAKAHQVLRSSAPMDEAVHTAFADVAELAAGWTDITSAVPPLIYTGADR
ncbi:DUF4254 domain-containing protein [Nocardia nova]|uniref:DUF4254 domain-containing protein n=1 Tax=Nocardia nova TaxID=37330 RepID=UPI0033E93FDB